MSYQEMSDEQILKEIASNIEKKRLRKKIRVTDLANKGGYSAQTYSNLINRNTDIKLSTLVQILRGLGELDKLENLFSIKEPFNPLTRQGATAVRIRKPVGAEAIICEPKNIIKSKKSVSMVEFIKSLKNHKEET